MNAPAAAAFKKPLVATDQGAFAYFPIDDLIPSPTNPRKHFNEQKLAELARTIAGHGVLEPILGRKVAGDGKIEIVAGERRWRAARLAKRAEVPVILRELTDKQALEIQTIENAQREDLHPLEQAEGYERLIKDFGYTPEAIADAIGKGRAHVFQIRKLRQLAPKLREIFAAGGMDTTLATVLARVPGTALQEKAWQDLNQHFRDGFNFRVAADFVRKNYMLDLARAPFPIADATLNPKAGACGVCPKRTGNQPDLFPDVKNGNVCTDPQCFATKRAASQARSVKKLEDAGTRVITGAAAKQIMPYGHVNSSNYTEPTSHCYEDRKRRTWGQLAKVAGADEVKIQSPETGQLETIIDRAAVRKALAAKGIKLEERVGYRTSAAELAKRKTAEEKVRVENQARRLILFAIRANVRKTDLIAPPVLSIVVASFWRHIWHEYRKKLGELWGWKDAPHDHIDARLKGLDAPTLSRMLVDCALIDAVNAGGYYDRGAAKLAAAARRWRVKDGTIRAAVQREAKLKKDAKASAAKKKKTKAPSKARKS